MARGKKHRCLIARAALLERAALKVSAVAYRLFTLMATHANKQGELWVSIELMMRYAQLVNRKALFRVRKQILDSGIMQMKRDGTKVFYVIPNLASIDETDETEGIDGALTGESD